MTNLMTHTGRVHATGRVWKGLDNPAPRCVASASAANQLHFAIPTQAEVTCKKCLAILGKEEG